MTLAEIMPLDVKCRVVDEITTSILEEELKDLGHNSIKYLFTPTELILLEDYIPSIYHKVAGDLGINNEDNIGSKLAFQVQSELVNKASTLDSGIIHGRRDEGTVRSKIYNWGRLCRMAELLGLGEQEGLSQKVLDSGDFDEILIAIKLKYADFLRKIPVWAEPVKIVRRSAKLDRMQKKKFSYFEDLIKLGGDDIRAIVVYGSSAKENDPRNYSDYDNFLVVRDGSLGRLYLWLKGKKFKHKDGKSIGLNLIEEGVFTKYIRFNHDPNEHLERCVVLCGEVDFPVVPEKEIQERGTSFAVLRTKALKSACCWVTRDPEILLDKKELFEYFQKSPRFIMHSALNNTEGIRERCKKEINERVSELGACELPFKSNKEHILRATYQVAVCATRILEKYYRGKKFDNGFMRF